MTEPSVFARGLQQQIYRLVRNYEFCDRECLGQHGVTASQGYTLLSVPHEGNLSMSELSEAMELATSTMTRMVDQLVSKGLVTRRPDDEDRRVVRIALTLRGQEVRLALAEELERFFEQVLAEVPTNRRSTILDALEEVNRLMSRLVKASCG